MSPGILNIHATPNDLSSLDPRENTGVGPYICKSASDGIGSDISGYYTERKMAATVYRTPVSSRGRHRNPIAKVAKDGQRKEKEKRSPSQRGEERRGRVNGMALSERGSATFIGKRDVAWIRKLCPAGMSAFSVPTIMSRLEVNPYPVEDRRSSRLSL